MSAVVLALDVRLARDIRRGQGCLTARRVHAVHTASVHLAHVCRVLRRPLHLLRETVDEIGRRGIAHLQPRSDHLLLNGDNPGTLRALVHLGGSDYLVTVMFRLGVDHPVASWLDHHEHDYFH